MRGCYSGSRGPSPLSWLQRSSTLLLLRRVRKFIIDIQTYRAFFHLFLMQQWFSSTLLLIQFLSLNFRDHLLKEWDISTCTCLRSLQGHRGPVFCVKVRLCSFLFVPIYVPFIGIKIATSLFGVVSLATNAWSTFVWFIENKTYIYSSWLFEYEVFSVAKKFRDTFFYNHFTMRAHCCFLTFF